MKLIHTADIHLGAKMDSRFPKEVTDRRREELRNSFRRLVAYARETGVRAILLSGDVFDSDQPFKKDKAFFYSVVRSEPSIDFYYLRGNHDLFADAGEEIENLKTFTDEWTRYDLGEAVLWGIEMSPGNATSLYSSLLPEKDRTNLVMLHGQIGDSAGRDRVCLKKLRGKNIDYLALGHVHKPQEGELDERGVYVYPGCLEGRGFDEPGEHGFMLLDVGEKIARTFVPFAERTVCEREVDVGDLKDAYSVYLRIKEKVAIEKQNIYRVILTGETDYDVEDLSTDVKKYLSGDCFYADVKDKTRKKIDLKAFEGDPSLRGEFVRCVYENGNYSEEEKQQIVALGLRAFEGGEL